MAEYENDELAVVFISKNISFLPHIPTQSKGVGTGITRLAPTHSQPDGIEIKRIPWCRHLASMSSSVFEPIFLAK